jgi:hypothetical protein
MTEHHRKAKAPRKRQRIPGHTPEDEFADELRVKKDTLRKWRRLGKTCAYVVLGRQVHYVDEDKPRWLESLRVTPPRAA